MPYPSWLRPLALVVFVLHAANYLYFFVDDEAIVLVYAQNLLAGRGLAYSPTDGRLEGYANFLHVLLSTGWLAAVRLAGVSDLWVFAVGSLWSLLAACGTILLAARVMASFGTATIGAATGLGFLALAGPFAAWAVTPLETATFALLCLALVALLTAPIDAARDRLIVATAVLLLLYRLDGFVFVGAAFVSAAVFGGPVRRRALLRTVLPLTLLCGGVYWAWRMWYFGDFLPMPFYAKIAFKLMPAAGAVTKMPDTPYLAAFASLYWYLPLIALVTGWMFFTRDRRLWTVFGMLAACAVYVNTVGDWMFGFRFVVALLPLTAILGAATVMFAAARHRAAGAAACAVTLAISLGAAVRLAGATDLDYRESWYGTPPSRAAAPYFGRYYPVVEALRPHVRPGDRIAYNQAGLVAFLLDLDNLDTLGLCSRFYATLPTRDVIFTEVGRYTALTNKPALRATEMYLLRHRPRFIVETAHLLRMANGGIVPPEILGGRYRLAFPYAGGEAAIFESTGRTGDAVEDPARYYENLAHTANLQSARVGHAGLRPSEYQAELPYLQEQMLTKDVHATYAAVLTLREASVVSELYVHRLQTSVPGRVSLALFDGDRQVYAYEAATDATVPQGWHLAVPTPVRADRVVLTIALSTPGLMRLEDVRVLGQTPGLHAFVAAELARRKAP